MEKGKSIVAGFDVGGAHLKVARAESGRVVVARTFATPIWQGLDSLVSAIGEAAPLYAGPFVARSTALIIVIGIAIAAFFILAVLFGAADWREIKQRFGLLGRARSSQT